MTPKTSILWTKTVSWGFLAFALIWGLAPYDGINEPARLLLDMLDWPLGDAEATLSRSQKWLSAIGGGLVLALSILLLGIVVPALEKGDRRTVRTAIAALVAWYLFDSVGSAYSGVASNVFFNTIFVVAILIPLISIRYEK